MTVNSKAGQGGRILKLLINARGGWVSLSQILDLKISQFGARILELRRSGLTIENKTETVNGKRYSWYRLCAGTRHTSPPRQSTQDPSVGAAPSLFGNLGRWHDPEERR